MILLFSYGTLQDAAVQLSTFGRRVVSTPDALFGFQISFIEIADLAFVRASGKARHEASAAHPSAATSQAPGKKI